MEIRRFHRDDAPALVELSASCARGETDFVLNPFWESEEELYAEFERLGIEPEQHVLVADSGGEGVTGLAGFLRRPDASAAGMFCPIVKKGERGRGVGGELLRACQRLGTEELGIRLMAAGIGTRNRAGYSLLTSHGFRPVRQHFLMRCDAPSEMEPPEGLRFERAEPGDAEAILSIYRDCGFEPRELEVMRGALAGTRHSHAVARRDGAVQAFVEIETHWPRRVWVAYVGVTRELRGRGLGSGLVAWALQRQLAAGADQALLLLSPANRTALRAYEKVGFRRHRLVDVLEKGF